MSICTSIHPEHIFISGLFLNGNVFPFCLFRRSQFIFYAVCPHGQDRESECEHRKTDSENEKMKSCRIVLEFGRPLFARSSSTFGTTFYVQFKCKTKNKPSQAIKTG